VRHFGTLLLKEERAVFASPIAYATVAVYLLLMGYTFTAVLFLNRTGELVRVFFQAAVLFLLIVPVVTMRLFAEERRTGTLELLLQVMTLVTFAVRTLATYGITDLLLTNAAGGVNRSFRAGDFMILTDHINLMGTNPLRGAEIAGMPRFVDLTEAYDKGLRRLMERAAKARGIKLRSGVYLAVSGPSYETPAEIRAFAVLGADAVGMSTVPEAIVARQCGLRVVGVSCITNLAAGISKGKLSHAEVLETAERVKKSGAALIKNFTELYGHQ